MKRLTLYSGDEAMGFGRYKYFKPHIIHSGTLELPKSYIFNLLTEFLTDFFSSKIIITNESQYINQFFAYPNIKSIDSEIINSILHNCVINNNLIYLSRDSWTDSLWEVEFYESNPTYTRNHIDKTNTNVFNFSISDKYICVFPGSDHSTSHYESINYISLIEEAVNLFNSMFTPENIFNNRSDIVQYNESNEVDYFNIESKFGLLGGNPSYIDWAIRTVEGFVLEPAYLRSISNSKVYQFSGINISQINNDIVEFKQNFIQHNHQYNEFIFQINQHKYDKYIIQCKQDQEKYDLDLLRARQEDEDYGSRSDAYEDSFDALTDGQYGRYNGLNDSIRYYIGL